MGLKGVGCLAEDATEKRDLVLLVDFALLAAVVLELVVILVTASLGSSLSPSVFASLTARFLPLTVLVVDAVGEERVVSGAGDEVGGSEHGEIAIDIAVSDEAMPRVGRRK